MTARNERFGTEEQSEQNIDALFLKLNKTRMTRDDVSDDLRTSDLMRFDWYGLPWDSPSGVTSPVYEPGTTQLSGLMPLYIRENAEIQKFVILGATSGHAAHDSTNHLQFQIQSKDKQTNFSAQVRTDIDAFPASGVLELNPPYEFDGQVEKGDILYVTIDATGSPAALGPARFQLEVIATRR